jgi:hypothetical protein
MLNLVVGHKPSFYHSLSAHPGYQILNRIFVHGGVVFGVAVVFGVVGFAGGVVVGVEVGGKGRSLFFLLRCTELNFERARGQTSISIPDAHALFILRGSVIGPLVTVGVSKTQC